MYRYASSRASANAIRRDRPLTDEEIRRAAPSVFAQEAHESRGERYGFIPTIDVLTGLRRAGFEPFEARQTKVRDTSKREHTRHLLRLRHPDAPANREVAPEIILLNSHDGSSSYQLLSGFFRFVCDNGLIAGDVCDDIRITHRGRSNLVDDVIDGCITVLDNVETAAERIQAYQSILLTESHQRALASAALALKYDDPAKAPVIADQLLQARRFEDRQPTLWNTFNRIQENLIKGGLRGRSGNGRRTSTRAVTGVDQDVKLNRALWTLTDHLAKARLSEAWLGSDELTGAERRALELAA
jgi:hypothetical protein